MARIILEDMKLNKGRRPTILKKEAVISPEEIREEINRQKNIRNEQKPEIVEQPQKQIEEYIDESKKENEEEDSKINEYFKNKNVGVQRLQRTPAVRKKSIIIHKPVLVIFIISILLGGVYWGGNIFQKANVTITSKHQLINYQNEQFIAGKDENGNNVNFEIMITSNKKSVNVILTEPKDVSIKAQGSITLYNEFSTKAEKLSSGVFISDNDGKTYKINNAVSIPGYKTDANKKIIPGQISVGITSFLPGDSYNGSPSSFHVSSLKGTTKYNKIYGKLKNPLVGGASGVVYTLDANNKKNIESVVNSSFKQDLLQQVRTLVPPGYIIYPGAFTFSYDGIDNVLSKTAETSVNINGTLAVVLLKEKSLMDNIIKTSLSEIKGGELKEIKISDLSKLSFNFTNKDQVILKDMSSIPFTLSGQIDAIWNPDIELLKSKLAGVSKDAVLPIFREDKGISSAVVKIFPPWQKYISSDTSKINIIVK